MVAESVLEARAHLPELIQKARAGETVILLSDPDGLPVARLEAIGPAAQPPLTSGSLEEASGMSGTPAPRRLGAWETPGFELTDAFWEPLTDEECGYADDGLL